jgi:hypothetical protein
MLVVVPMAVIVLLGVYAVYHVGAEGQQETNNRVRSLAQQQQGMERIAREMRQATGITPISSQVLDATTWVRPVDGSASVLRRVRFDCSTGSCLRSEGPVGGSLTGSVKVIGDVQNADVFQLEPNTVDPTRVGMHVEVGVPGASSPLVLDGGFALRNLTGF